MIYTRSSQPEAKHYILFDHILIFKLGLNTQLPLNFLSRLPFRFVDERKKLRMYRWIRREVMFETFVVV